MDDSLFPMYVVQFEDGQYFTPFDLGGRYGRTDSLIAASKFSMDWQIPIKLSNFAVEEKYTVKKVKITYEIIEE